MPRIAMADMPDQARLWVFPGARRLSEDEGQRIVGEAHAFLDGWAAHGRPLTSSCELRDGWFLLVGADERSAPPSGCSIDALTNRLRLLGQEMGTGFIDHSPVWYRDERGEVARVGRREFSGLARDGSVGLDTRVFNTTLTRLGELRGGKFELAAAESWHARLMGGTRAGARGN